MATADPQYDPGIGGSSPSPPVTIDGTGLASTVPLLIKNGKTQSGLELQVTGTAGTGVLLRDSGGTAVAAFGYAVGATDWFSAGGGAGDLNIAFPSGKNLEIGVLNGTGNLLKITSGGTITVNGTLDLAGAVFKFPSSNSLTSVGMQVTGDANTGVGQTSGADTLSIVCGGTAIGIFSTASGTDGCLLRSPDTSQTIRIANGGFAHIGKVGFCSATPITQPSATGETVGFTAGAGTAVTDASTFTGNVGATAYRLSDVVKHLKNLGLIAS
jgi:hypothetical protein